MVFTIRINVFLDVIAKHSIIHQKEARNSCRETTEQLLMLNRWNSNIVDRKCFQAAGSEG